MVNVADTGLIDAHAKRDGGDDDALIRCHPAVLNRAAEFIVQSGMVGLSGKAGLLQVSAATRSAVFCRVTYTMVGPGVRFCSRFKQQSVAVFGFEPA